MKYILFVCVSLYYSLSYATDRRPDLNNYCDGKMTFASAELSLWSIFYFKKIYNVRYETVGSLKSTTAFADVYPNSINPKYIYISYAPDYISQIISNGFVGLRSDYIRELDDSECDEIQTFISDVKNIKTGTPMSILLKLGYRRTSINQNIWTYEASDKLKLYIEVLGKACDSRQICEDEEVQQFSKIVDYRVLKSLSHKK